MDYEKAYNNILLWAKDMYDRLIMIETGQNAAIEPKTVMEILERRFPTLCDSEECFVERARNFAHDFTITAGGTVTQVRNISRDTVRIFLHNYKKWLERQKEPLTPEEKMNHPLYLEGFDIGKKVGESLKEQQPAEWSEEDEKMLERCISKMANIIPVPGKHGLTNMSFEKHTDEKLAAWLKSLPERFNLQPKQEWSKEDEFFRQQLIIYCENCVQDTLAAKCVDWLKSLRPQLSWKPSEEQMSDLWLAATMNTVTCKTLKSLYNDLQKLL